MRFDLSPSSLVINSRPLNNGASDAAESEFRHGWPVVLACFAVAVFAWGFAAFGPAVYLPELQRRTGWSAALIGGATTTSFVIGALLLPWVGAVIERFGARAVLSGGVVLLGAGAAGISRVVDPWQLYASNVLMGFGWAGASSTAVSTTLSQYFDRRLGMALSLALTGASAGGFAVAPGLIALSQRDGFPSAASELTMALAAVILPLVFVCLRGPRRAAQRGAQKRRPAVGRRDALRDKHFWSIAAPFALAISAQVGMMVYQVVYLLPLLGVAGTSAALVCTSVSAAGGRLVMSTMLDHLDQRPIAAATFASQAAALSLMIAMPGLPPALYLGSIVFGLGMGNVVALPSLIIQREFAPQSFGLVLGLSTAIGQIGYSISPALLGVVHDLLGSYRATVAVCIGLQVAASMLILQRGSGQHFHRP
jgi:predicted MFS family arabinose efflux permease